MSNPQDNQTPNTGDNQRGIQIVTVPEINETNTIIIGQSSLRDNPNPPESTSGTSLGNTLSILGKPEDSFANFEFYPGVERIDYDFVAERTSIFTTNLLETISHLIKSCLGAGILGLHEAYMKGGLWTSLIANSIIGLIIGYNQLMLGLNAQKMYRRLRVPKLSYQDLVEVVVATGPLKCWRRHSKAFRYFLDVCLFIQLCGTCCIYQIMIAKTLQLALEKVSANIHGWSLTLKEYIIIITGPLIFLCMIRNLKYLAPFSLLADFFILLCVTTTMYYSIMAAGDISERPAWKSFHGLFHLAGVCIYSIDGVAMTLPIENNMRHPEHFPFVMKLGMSIVVLITMMVGFFGYWGWGEESRTPITIHMPLELGPIIVQFTLCVMLAVTFTIHFWVPFRILWQYLGRKIVRKRSWWERLFRLLHIVMVTIISLFLPNLNTIMSLMGNIFLTIITFVYPAVIDCLVNWRESGGLFSRRFLRSIIIVIIGVCLGIGGLCTF